MGGGAAPAGTRAPISADQARQLILSRGYTNLGTFYRSEDSPSWETMATIDGVPYIVDVDNDGMIVAR
jgi:hypothetical protein